MENERKGLIIGLTGQTGAGKTSVSQMLTTRGYSVIDADKIARDVVAKGTQCLLELALEFDMKILNADGTLNRKKLAEIAFRDKDKRRRLNEITHPYILEAMRARAEALFKEGEPVVFMDAPTLFESGGDKVCDKVISVIAPRGVRLDRIMTRDALTLEEAEARMGAQHDDGFYTSRSDYVVVNDLDLQVLRVRVARMLENLGLPGQRI